MPGETRELHKIMRSYRTVCNNWSLLAETRIGVSLTVYMQMIKRYVMQKYMCREKKVCFP